MNNLRHFAMSLAFVFGGVITGCSSDGSDENSAFSHGSVSSIEQGSASSNSAGSSSTNSSTGSKGSTSSTSTSTSTTSVPSTGGSSVGSGGSSQAASGSGSTVLQCGQILGSCSADSDCCSSYACTGGICRERLLATGGNTSVSTSTTGGSSAGLCMPLNGPCETSSICCNAQQCISGYCGGPAIPTSSGGSTSISTTIPVSTGGSSNVACYSEEKSCSVSSECCASLTCQSGRCRSPLLATGGNSGNGGSSATTAVACMTESQSCSTSATCCASLTCQNGQCRYAALATGGNSGNGGSSATTAVAGYTSLAGGSSPTGGSVAAGGSTVVATGGSSACTPASRPVNTSTSTAGLTCGQPVRDGSFPEASLNFVDRFAAISSTDIVAIGHTLSLRGYLIRWNQSEMVWDQDMSFPTGNTETSVLQAVSRKDADTMLIGGNAQCTGCLLVPHAWYGWKTTWVDVRQGLPAHGSVADVMFIQGKGYALVNNDDAGSAEVYKLNIPPVGESVFSWSLVTSFPQMIASKLWATSESDIFAVGGRMVSGVYAKGLVFHFDGCTWNEVSLPSDITRVISFHGSEGTVIALGYTGSQKARLTATDLSSWTRSSGDDSMTIDTAVWMNSPSAALIGGAGRVLGNGSAWISTGLSPWTASALDTAYADGVSDVAPIPGTSSFLIGSKQMVAGTFESRVYRVTCQ